MNRDNASISTTKRARAICHFVLVLYLVLVLITCVNTLMLMLALMLMIASSVNQALMPPHSQLPIKQHTVAARSPKV